jgi:hypothetical protein
VGGVEVSEYIELINPQTMKCTLLKNGVAVDVYDVMQCDKCALIQKFDSFGYQKSAEDNPIWFCFGCRNQR